MCLLHSNAKKSILGRNNKQLILTFLTLIGIIIFDLLISSSSIFPFRLIFDIAFMMILFVVVYISYLLLDNMDINENSLFFNFPKISLILPIMFNLKATISILWLSAPNIGHLHKNMLFQNIISLFPLLDFIMIMTANGVFLYFIISKRNSISMYEIPLYIIGAIAIETAFANYCFYAMGVDGIRLGLFLVHIGLCGVFCWLLYNFKTIEFKVKTSFPDVLLLFLSIGIFLMVYFRGGNYLIFTDNTIVTASTIGIIFRDNLNSYYMSTNYYSPIGGFVSTIFAFICGVDNILLASILPFFVGHLLLPFVVYHFLKTFVTDDSRIAIIGVVMSLLMDGLAVILLPSYIGKLTPDIINWVISPATMSLYKSSLNWIFLKPFNTLGTVSAIATCSILYERKKVSLFLGGTLFFLSFVNLRQPYLTVLLLIFMFGTKKVDIKEIIIIGLAAIVSCGPVISTIVYVVMKAIVIELTKVSLITEAASTQNITFIQTIVENPLIPNTICILGSLVAIIYLLKLEQKGIESMQHYTSQLEERTNKKLVFNIHKKTIKLSLIYQDALFLGMMIITIMYIIFYAHKWLPPILASFVVTDLVAPLNYIVMRYHVLLMLIIISILEIKYDLRTFVTLSILIMFAYLGLLGGVYLLHVPTIFVVLALPVFNLFVKNHRKMMILVVLLFVFIGLFSASLYTATANTIESDPRIIDLPNILQILLNENPKENVFTPSYPYYVKRTLQMANIQRLPGNDPSSSIYLIDNLRTSKTESARISELLYTNNYKILYHGKGFSLLEKTPINNYYKSINDTRVNPSEAITLTGRLNGTVPITSGKSGLSFDGSHDYVRVEPSPSLNLDNNMTIIAWIKPEETGTVKNIILKGNGSNISYGLGTTSGNKFRFMLHDSSDILQWFGSKTSFEANKWYFVAVTFNKPKAIIYINGVPDREYVLDYNIQQSSELLAIGRTGSTNSMYFKGLVDEVRIYSRTLSEKEIMELYQGFYNNEAGLVLYLNFNGDAQDRSGNGNNGTIYGATWITGTFLNMNVKAELNGALVKTVNVVNATDGSYEIPGIVTPNSVGAYNYTIYEDHGFGENQTVEIIVDNVKITEGGVTDSYRYVGQEQTIWFKAEYEYDDQEFNETSGMLYLNNVSMKWSKENRRWEHEYVPTEPGQHTFEITSVRDMRYNLTSINDAAGSITINIVTRWYDPLNIGLSNPLIWMDLGFFILVNICYYFGIQGFSIKRNLQ